MTEWAIRNASKQIASNPTNTQVQFVSVKAERPNNPSRSHARQGGGGVGGGGGGGGGPP